MKANLRTFPYAGGVRQMLLAAMVAGSARRRRRTNGGLSTRRSVLASSGKPPPVVSSVQASLARANKRMTMSVGFNALSSACVETRPACVAGCPHICRGGCRSRQIGVRRRRAVGCDVATKRLRRNCTDEPARLLKRDSLVTGAASWSTASTTRPRARHDHRHTALRGTARQSRWGVLPLDATRRAENTVAEVFGGGTLVAALKGEYVERGAGDSPQ